VEVDGQVSVIRQDWASPVQKADVFDEAARERDRARAGGAQGTAPAGA
jgi:hypothetical protein